MKNKAKVVLTGLAGVAVFLAAISIIWTVMNFDVLVKAVRFPEAVRQMKVELRVSQLSK